MSDPLGLWTYTQRTIDDPLGLAEKPDTSTAPDPLGLAGYKSLDPLGLAGTAVAHPRSFSSGIEDAVQAASNIPGPSWGERHPFLNIVADMAKDVANTTRVSLISAHRGGGLGGVGIGMSQYFMEKAAKDGPEAAQEEMWSVARGGALVASFGGGALLEGGVSLARPLLTRALPELFLGRGGTRTIEVLLGKAGSFLAGEFLGGSIYSAIAPKEDDMSRIESILYGGSSFAVVGGATAPILHLLGKFVDRLPAVQRAKIRNAAERSLARVQFSLKRANTSLVDLPIAQQEAIARDVYTHAIQTTDPQAVDIDQIIREEADRAVEPHPRIVPARPELAVSPEPPAPTLPEVPFEQSLLKTPEFLVPPAAEPTGQPRGFIEGPGTPEGTLRANAPPAPVPSDELLARAKAVEDRLSRIPPNKGTSEPLGVEFKRVADNHGLQDFAAPNMDKVFSGEVNLFITRNTRHGVIPGEGPWRVTQFDGNMTPTGHHTFGSLKEAEEFASQNGDFVETRRRFADGDHIAVHQVYVQPAIDAGIDPELATHLGARDAMNEGLLPGRTAAEIIDVFNDIQKFSANSLEMLNAPDRISRMQRIDAAAQLEIERTASAALEPHELTPGEPPPQGFEQAPNVKPDNTGFTEGFTPTSVGKLKLAATPGNQAGGSASAVKQLALTDAAVDAAVARIDLLEISSPQIKSEAVMVEQSVHDPALASLRPDAATRGTIQKALEVEGDPTPALLRGLTTPTPSEIVLDQNLTKAEQKIVRQALKQTLDREIPPISIDPLEEIAAPGILPPSTIAPVVDEMTVVGKMDDRTLEILAQEFNRTLRDQAGGASARLLASIAGGGMELYSTQDNISPTARSVLRTAGAILLIGAFHPQLTAWTKKYLRSFLLHANPTSLFVNAGDKEVAQRFVETLTEGRALGHMHAADLRKAIDPKNYRAVMLLADEAVPSTAPEWAQLNPLEQRTVMYLNKFNFQLGQMLKTQDAGASWIERYMRNQLPPETYERWKINGYKPQAPGTAKQHIMSLREIEQWAKVQGVPEPNWNLPGVQSAHVESAHRLVGNVRMIKAFERLNTIQPIPRNALIPLPEGMVQLKIPGYGNRMAPEAVARALQNLHEPTISHSNVLNAFDSLKSAWMRSIMMWFWEHGVNGLRAKLVLAMNPVDGGAAWRAVANNDPILVHAAKFGLNLFDRPDYAPKIASVFERMINKLGPAAPTLQAVRRAGAHLIERQDRMLWDQIIPSFQLFAWQNEMNKWGEQTAHKFLAGSPEYTAAARHASSFANTALGKMPLTFANPRMLQFMRLVLFSPQWTTSRLALTAHAGGELSEIIAGRVNPLHTAYLPLKMRQFAWMAGLTWAGSQLLSGQDPQFNPNTHKFYMKTGLKINGKDVGLDLAGWWQDDLRAVGAPLDFLYNRLNPVFKVGYETVSGRDYLGRSMTNIDRMTNLFNSLGPPAEAANLAARGAQQITGGPAISGGEILQRSLGVAAFGNVASLPRPIDAAMAKLANRLLRNTGVPVNSDNIFELSRLLRGNFMAGHDFVDNRVITYLSYRRRGAERREPISTGIARLFEHGRRILAEF